VIPWRIFPRGRIQSHLVVLRFLAISFALGALVFPRIVHADDSENYRAFAQFVREGDRARLAGRNPEALVAYQKAHALRPGPLLLGRIGLVYLDGGLPVQAATHLYRALIDISDIPQSERWGIQDAYSRARSAVVRIKVDVSQVGAEVTMDENPQPLGGAANQFYFFTTPGHHEIRAKLVGYEDAVASIDVKKGQTELVSLVLKPIPPSPLPPKSTLVPRVIAKETQNSAKLAYPKPSYLVKPGPWSFGGGVTALSGAISYVPATGIVVSADRRFGEVLSIRFDGRAAWSPQYVTTRPLRGFTYAGLVGACANRTRYFGCGLAHLGVIGISLDTDKPYTWWNWRFGLGAAAGVQLPINRSFLARFALDVVFFSDNTRILGGSFVKPFLLWSGPPILGGLSFTLVWRPELRVLR